MEQKYRARIYVVDINNNIEENTHKTKVKNGFLRIYLGKWKFQFWIKLDINKVDYKLADENNILHFVQYPTKEGGTEVIQVPQKIKPIDTTNDEMLPVGSDIIKSALACISRCRNTLTKKSWLQKLLPYIGVMLIFILAIVLFALLQRGCGG